MVGKSRKLKETKRSAKKYLPNAILGNCLSFIFFYYVAHIFTVHLCAEEENGGTQSKKMYNTGIEWTIFVMYNVAHFEMESLL